MMKKLIFFLSLLTFTGCYAIAEREPAWQNPIWEQGTNNPYPCQSYPHPLHAIFKDCWT